MWKKDRRWVLCITYFGKTEYHTIPVCIRKTFSRSRPLGRDDTYVSKRYWDRDHEHERRHKYPRRVSRRVDDTERGPCIMQEGPGRTREGRSCVHRYLP